SAAYDVIQILNKKRNSPLALNDMMLKDLHLLLESKADKKLFCESLTAAQNFFKHGNSDPDSAHTLDTRFTEVLLFDAVQKYARLVGQCPKTMTLYFLWFVSLCMDRHPDALDRFGIPDSVRENLQRSRKVVPTDRARFYAEYLP